MISSTTLTTLRRRVVDKVCKDPIFLKDVLVVALETGAIKTADLLTTSEIKRLLKGA